MRNDAMALTLLLLIFLAASATAFISRLPPTPPKYTSRDTVPSSLCMSSSKEIYGVAGSGWSSPSWNWGSAVGTGHDCAAICRRKYASRSDREALVDALLHPSFLDGDESASSGSVLSEDPRDPPFEEVKLVLGLAWQNGRWDGSDGGEGGYGEVLSTMAAADRYEKGTEDECAKNFVDDVKERFHLVATHDHEMKEMGDVHLIGDLDASRRRCAGLVLRTMGFVEKGL